jgi:hypothetical protein
MDVYRHDEQEQFEEDQLLCLLCVFHKTEILLLTFQRDAVLTKLNSLSNETFNVAFVMVS